MTDLPISIRADFERGGWHPGRRVAVPPHVPAGHPAAGILAEFGGLKVGRDQGGEQCATADLDFSPGRGQPRVIKRWCTLLKTTLVLVAGTHDWYAELYVDATGRCFLYSGINDVLAFFGDSFAEAAERLILGRVGRPMLRPDQAKISWFAELIGPEDDRVYRY